MPIMTHSHPLPPRTGIQLVTSSFFVSLLILEIRPLERLLVCHCKNGGVFEIRFFNRLTNTTLLLFCLPDATALTMHENERGSPQFGVLSWLSW